MQATIRDLSTKNHKALTETNTRLKAETVERLEEVLREQTRDTDKLLNDLNEKVCSASLLTHLNEKVCSASLLTHLNEKV